MPTGAAGWACVYAAQVAAAAPLRAAVTNATTANLGAPSCFVAGAARRGLAQLEAATAPADNCSAVALSVATYVIPVIVPRAGSAGSALEAIQALTAASYDELWLALSTSSGCAAGAFAFISATVAAACGSAASGGSSCSLPGAAPTDDGSTGAIIGGVLGGAAALAIFVTAVLVARGACACCCCCCCCSGGGGGSCRRLRRCCSRPPRELGHEDDSMEYSSSLN